MLPIDDTLPALGAHLRAQPPQEAMATATALLREAPGAAESHYAVGVAALQMGRQSMAVSALKTAASMARDSAEIARTLGETLLVGEDPDGAVTALRHALHLRPTDVDTQVSLAIGQASQGATTQATEALSRVLRDHPDHAIAWVYLGLARETQGRHDDASDCFLHATLADPDDAVVWFHRGRDLAARAFTSAAQAALRRALDLTPGHVEASALLERLRAGQR